MQFKLPKARSFGPQEHADSSMAGIQATNQILLEIKLTAQAWEIYHAGVKVMSWEAGD